MTTDNGDTALTAAAGDATSRAVRLALLAHSPRHYATLGRLVAGRPGGARARWPVRSYGLGAAWACRKSRPLPRYRQIRRPGPSS